MHNDAEDRGAGCRGAPEAVMTVSHKNRSVLEELDESTLIMARHNISHRRLGSPDLDSAVRKNLLNMMLGPRCNRVVLNLYFTWCRRYGSELDFIGGLIRQMNLDGLELGLHDYF